MPAVKPLIVTISILGMTASLTPSFSASDRATLTVDKPVLVQERRLSAADAAGQISGFVTRGKSDQVAALRAPRVGQIDADEAAYVDITINSQIDVVYFLYPDGPEPIFSVVDRDCEGWRRSSAVCIMSVLQQAIALQVFH